MSGRTLIRVTVIAGAIVLLLQGCCRNCRIENVVTIDFEMAETMIDWLESAAAGVPEDSLRSRFFEEIAPTLGCQAIIWHWARFREWNEELFYDFILEGMGLKEGEGPLVDDQGIMTSLGKRRSLWTAALAAPDRLRELLHSLREAELRRPAARLATKYLPRDTDITNEFYVVLFGGSSAFSVGDVNGYDLLQMPLDHQGNLDIPEIERTFAHELHHTGFSNSAGFGMQDLEDSSSIDLIGLLVVEGMATRLVSRTDDHLEHYRTAPGANARGIARDWDRLLPQLPDLYRQAERDIRRNFEGEVDLTTLLGYWVEGYQGPAYILGSDMIALIEDNLGRKVLRSLPSDYRLFLDIYNRAAEKAARRGEEVFLFDTALVEAVKNLRN
ncbi:DUF5700 domain-containing putative Zn-dependent protease [Gemmatimonadota bacterium]